MMNTKLNILLISFGIAGLWSCENSGSDKAVVDAADSLESPVYTTAEINTLSNSEKQTGWALLFDGVSVDQWRGDQLDSFPKSGWKIEDGLLTVMESDGSEGGRGGDIITRKKYSDFELTLDFKLSEGANSGIKYYVVEGLNKGGGSAIGLEYQLLDDERHPDAKMGKEGNRTVGSLYDLIPASENKTVNPPGEWNTARIISKDGHVEHWLNGEKVLEYERGSEAYRDLVAQSKYTPYENFGEAEEGHILIQDHGNEVSFKNIKIRDLSDE